MQILVINAGSSSMKYQLIETDDKTVLAKGLAERIGIAGSRVKHQFTKNGASIEKVVEQDLPNHNVAFEIITQLLTDKEDAVIASPEAITAVGHRIVHGGEKFSETQVITPEVKETIRALIPLAPLHNPANLIGVEAAEKFFPNAVQVAVFDTAFHQTLPEHAFRYAIPEKFYAEEKIRVYGFHGTSHKYVYNEAKKYLKNEKLKAITIHLGNGSSMTAIDENGHSIDTSLGFGPLCGLIMGTRSGDIDPSVIFHMLEQLNMPLEKIKNVLNKESGMLGLAGSSDARDVAARYNEGDPNAALTFEMYGYRIRKYIGAYMAALNGVDALIFTAGLGENSILTRRYACKNLEGLGIELDEELNVDNNHADTPVEIQTPSGKVKILIVPTNEEWQIAKEVAELVAKA
ncbi:acetate kinase [Lacibacter luteus]|uniref:Acetate kinase n=1 Tax=Lacibacter luteus TaxID=2508719 RepID=A0A4Q1CLV7_9BACT|nr:acetate kinase [Lacibacter luteus]RXK61986.1 acetate kinase [Lacibacter luteus]